MPLKTAKGKKGACDRLVSKIVRTITPYCQKCGTPDGLTASHIIGRTYSATRTDLDNLQVLCFSCHRRYTDFPVEFAQWISDTIGDTEYERLRQRAEFYRGKFDWDAEYIRLKALVQ